MVVVAKTPTQHGPPKVITVWLVTDATLPGFRLFEICNPDEKPDGLGDHDEASVVLQYLEYPGENGEELDDLVLTALQVHSWQIAHSIHSARIARRAMRRALG